MATADLSDFQSRLKGLTDAGSVSPPQLSADKATAAYTVTLSVDPASTTAVHAVEGPIRAGAHAAAPAVRTCWPRSWSRRSSRPA